MILCMEKCCKCIPQRYLLVAFIVTGLVSCYLMRTCLQIALNEMTFKANTTKHDNSSTPHHKECPNQIKGKGEEINSRAEFHWSQSVQQSVIKSIYIGYIIAHIPAGILADLFGGKQIFGGGIVISAICSLISPMLAKLGPYYFMAGRIVLGFGQGVMFPGSSALIAKWAPPNERSTMIGLVQSGVMLGNGLGFIISGLILDAFPGWEPVFYFCGVLGLIWCLCWYTLCYSSPSEHPFITEEEKTMIETQIALTSKKKPKKIPWCKIVKSVPFFSAVLINFGHAWALFTMVNEMPLYTRKVLNYDIKGSALTSALPHFAMLPAAIGSGMLADYLIKNKITSITLNRKIFSFLSNTLPIPFLIGASFAGCNGTIVIMLLCFMMFFKGLVYSAVRANPIDLSPNFAGVLMGILNGTGAFGGLLGPMTVPLFITGDGSVAEWRNIFYTTAAIMFVFSLPFLCLASGEIQSWNNAPELQQEDTEAESPKEDVKNN